MNDKNRDIDLLEFLGNGKKAKEYYRKHFPVGIKSKVNYPSNNYQSTKNMLHVASRLPQAIFKITNYGKGKTKILNHLSYISRNGELTLEDGDGGRLETLKEQRDLLNAWEIDFGLRANSRDTVHITLSTPPGSDRDKALQASRHFLAKEFGKAGHPYVFVAHNDTAHPHVHMVVKMMSDYGIKLDPRKAYLHQMRESFSACCREQGLELAASRRYERGLGGCGVKRCLM